MPEYYCPKCDASVGASTTRCLSCGSTYSVPSAWRLSEIAKRTKEPSEVEGHGSSTTPDYPADKLEARHSDPLGALEVTALLAIWFVIGGILTIAPRLSPAASSSLATAALAVWLTLPVSCGAAIASPSKGSAGVAVVHFLSWLLVVGFLWSSLDK